MRSRADLASQAACAAFGIACSAALWSALHAPAVPKMPSAARVSVQVRSAAPARVPTTAQVPERPKDILPLRGDVSAPKSPVRKEPPPAATPAVAAPSVEPPVQVFPAEPFATIGQPLQVTRPPSEVQTLPTIAGAGAPPVPTEPEPFSLAQVIKPGGVVLVLGVLLDDAGRSINTKVIVPSAYPLQDLTHSFAHIGKQWTEIDPPMQPGEQRWIELRIDYDTGTPAQLP